MEKMYTGYDSRSTVCVTGFNFQVTGFYKPLTNCLSCNLQLVT